MRTLYKSNKDSKAANYLEKGLRGFDTKKDYLDFLSCSGNQIEKWFQLELAISFSKIKPDGIVLEDPKPFDKRTKSCLQHVGNSNCQVDIVYTRPKLKQRLVSALELKQGKSFSNFNLCYKDVSKVRKTAGSRWDYREVSFVFIYPYKKKRTKKEEDFYNRLKKSGYFYHWELSGKTSHWHIFALIWESTIRTSSSCCKLRKNFDAWVTEISDLFPELETVSPKEQRGVS